MHLVFSVIFCGFPHLLSFVTVQWPANNIRASVLKTETKCLLPNNSVENESLLLVCTCVRDTNIYSVRER